MGYAERLNRKSKMEGMQELEQMMAEQKVKITEQMVKSVETFLKSVKEGEVQHFAIIWRTVDGNIGGDRLGFSDLLSLLSDISFMDLYWKTELIENQKKVRDNMLQKALSEEMEKANGEAQENNQG